MRLHAGGRDGHGPGWNSARSQIPTILSGAAVVGAGVLLVDALSPVAAVLIAPVIVFAIARMARWGRPSERSAASEAALGNLVEDYRLDGALTTPVAAIVIELRGIAATTLVEGSRTWGDPIGIIARRMTAAQLGPKFSMARIGPHVFGAILRSSDETAALRAAEHLVALCRTPVKTSAGEVRVDAVAGVRHATVGERCSGEELIRAADAALRIDRGSASPVALIDRRLVRHAQSVIAVETEVRQSLDTDLLTSRLIPVVDVHRDAVVALRSAFDWTDVSSSDPELLGAVAESLGLRRAIETQSLMRTIAAAAESTGGGIAQRVVTRLDAGRLADPRAVSQIRLLLEASGFAAEHLVLELDSEDAATLDTDRIDELKDLGIGIGLALRHRRSWTRIPRSLTLRHDGLSVRADDVIDRAHGDVTNVRVQHLLRLSGGDLRQVTVNGVHDARLALELSAAGLSTQCGRVHGRPMSAADLREWVAHRAIN